jgi:apolipoprotein N-acyltransferase
MVMGGISPLSFAPYNIWLTGLVSVAVFAGLSTYSRSAKDFFYHAFAFAIAYFATGVSWVYVSIYHFGSASFLLSLLLTALFVSFVAFVFALPFYALKWIKPNLRLFIGIPLIWVLSEWIRTWFLTGFPWLFIGYSHVDNGLAGWAPIGGVLLLSLWAILSSCLLTSLFSQQFSTKTKYVSSVLIISLWLGGYGLKNIQWTSTIDNANNSDITIGLVQPNIPQELRWTKEYQDTIKQRLRLLSQPLWKNDWIIWPEAAIPSVYHNSLDFIEETRALAKQHNTTVISGVLYDQVSADSNQQQYFNSIIGIGDSEGIYHKQRLVPFGEYVPLENWIRGLIEFFNLPFSVISSGPAGQKNLRVGQYTLANAICYEITYPALVATLAADANVLLTVSNDAWFGDSIGPLQHFQMVRMRAIEVGRYIIRGTNNGVSAIIKPNGEVQQQSEQFIMTSMEGSVLPMVGSTPFMYWKNYLVLSLLLIMGLIGYDRRTYRVINKE